MSVREEESGGLLGLDDAFLRDIKGRIDSTWKIQRQLERCAILRSGITVEPESYNASVRELLSDLPLSVEEAVRKREEEYVTALEPQLEYDYYCGVPVTNVDEAGVRVSPREVEVEPEVDYEKLHDIIKEEADRAGLRWEYKKAGIEMGAVPKRLPNTIVKDLEDALTSTILEHRKKGFMYSWMEVLDALRKLKPQTPTPPDVIFKEE